jgi:hypothetical protein
VATELAEGLWTWRREHPEWHTGADYEPEVASYAVRLASAILLVDPLWPEDDSADYDWLDALARSDRLLVALLKPDHVRDGAGIAHAYGGRLLAGPAAAAEAGGEAPVHIVRPGDKLVDGVRALDDGRGRGETPLWLPAQRAVAFADGVRGDPDGGLRIWSYPPGREPAVREALSAIADLDPELVLVGHGAPVVAGGAAALRDALDRPPWEQEPE